MKTAQLNFIEVDDDARIKPGRGRPRIHPIRDPNTIQRRASHARDAMAVTLDLAQRNEMVLRALIRAHPNMARRVLARKLSA